MRQGRHGAKGLLSACRVGREGGGCSISRLFGSSRTLGRGSTGFPRGELKQEGGGVMDVEWMLVKMKRKRRRLQGSDMDYEQ